MIRKKLLFVIVISFITAAGLNSCGSENDKPVVQNGEGKIAGVTEDNVKVLAVKYFGSNVKTALYGKFTDNNEVKAAAGLEIENEDNWGIRFLFFKTTGEQAEVVYKTDLLQGSLTEGILENVPSDDDSYEMVYYNSGSFFMGSSGGEVFAYLADCQNKQLYYAHLYAMPDEPVYLYLSPEAKGNYAEEFFTDRFSSDFPDLTVTDEDYIAPY